MTKQEDYAEAIDKLLNDVRPKCDGHWGGDPADDWVTDETAQWELLHRIDVLAAYLQALV